MSTKIRVTIEFMDDDEALETTSRTCSFSNFDEVGGHPGCIGFTVASTVLAALDFRPWAAGFVKVLLSQMFQHLEADGVELDGFLKAIREFGQEEEE